MYSDPGPPLSLAAQSAPPAPAVRVEGLGKCYGLYRRPGDRLRQFLWPRLQRALRRPQRRYYEDFWALREVSFEIGRGETLGIVGCNGSGKSTLLQMICGTVAPTSGRVRIHGRVAALLELGSGFNPEFTGRENVFMNAAILGLATEEIEARFPAIAAFADIGDFIERPVKTYSSGMAVRLAFAVIAHVDADILIVDEALSVGDALFVQKCMRFIREFQSRGTLIFVSHDMGAVQNLCRKAIWLERGSVRLFDSAQKVAQAYLRHTLQQSYGDELRLAALGEDGGGGAGEGEGEAAGAGAPALDYGARAAVGDNLHAARGWCTGKAEMLAVSLRRLTPGPEAVFAGGERVRLVLRARANEAMARPILGFLLRDRLGQDLFGENTLPFTESSPLPVAAGQTFEASFDFRLPMLPNGQYVVMASVAEGDLQEHVQHHWLHDALVINVSSSRVRWGLVGIPFEAVALEIVDA